ncbi:MAG: CmcI family methyltransferase [Acidimicrobiales bacterium]
MVFHNMDREAKRTLHSLSRQYQRGIDDLRYEVLVVDNGSDGAHRLDPSWVGSFGEELRLVDMGQDAPPSPTVALNTALGLSTGANVAVMIDGAHVLTPGVLAHGMRGLETYAPAVVATQQWYVGPGQQPDTTSQGYDEAEEDVLFDRIAWPADGYRLFEIGEFIGNRDWFDGILESNCLFAPRNLLEQVGGFDNAFATPGGGYANLDLYERLASDPHTTLVTILGEGSFHQVHGGTTTNDAAPDGRRSKTFSYGSQYEELRGRSMRGPAKHTYYVGGFTSMSARRTRSRRLTGTALNSGRVREGVDGVPTEPTPIPGELATSFTEAYWHSLTWKNTTWLGQPIENAPTDLVTYQEIIERVRPDHIVITTRAHTGTAAFVASVCDLLDHGIVVTVSERPLAIEHARVRSVVGSPHAESTAAEVKAIVGSDQRGLVILGSPGGAQAIVTEFDHYAPLVGVDSFVIIENTIVNGRPVWPGYGPGPAEAVKSITPRHGNFVQDPGPERGGLTFNPGGYLRRVT